MAGAGVPVTPQGVAGSSPLQEAPTWDPVLGAGSKGLSLPWDLVKSFDKPDWAGASRKEAGPFLLTGPSLAVPRPF